MSQKLITQIKEKYNVDLKFPLLEDPGHKVIDRYGLLNPVSNRGIPHPAVYVIDKWGIVRWKFVETNYKIRATNEQILEALSPLN
jgi:peroxiredoxin